MKALLISVAGGSCLWAAQIVVGVGTPTPSAHAVTQAAPHKALSADTPLVGYAVKNGADIYTIVGSALRPRLGLQAPTPDGTARVYLPPLQQYALAEQIGETPLCIWNLRSASVPIAGAMAHPDLIAFSPRGESAALFNRAEGLVQVIAGLPATPKLMETNASLGSGELRDIAVSDDGSVAAAAFRDSPPKYSYLGGRWQILATSYLPHALSFVPLTHNLILSDTARSEIVLLSNLGTAGTVERVLAGNLWADRIAITKEGDLLLAASSRDGSVSSVNLASGAISKLPAGAPVSHISLLRGGRAFLLNVSPALCLISLPAESTQP